MKRDEVAMMQSIARLQLLEKASEMRYCGQLLRANWLVRMANTLREAIEEINRRRQQGG
jgi:hypothetical protein